MKSATRAVAAVVLLAFASATVPCMAAEEEQQKVRVTTFLLEHKGVDDALLLPGMRLLDDGLHKNPRLEMKDLDTRLADFAQEVPSDQVDEGRRALADGETALAAHDLATATKELRNAVDTLSRVLPFIKKQELAEAMVALGVTRCDAGDKKGCRAEFMRVLTWRTDQKYDVTKFSEKHLGLFEDAKKEIAKGRRGSLEIRSDPPAAQAYVDGRDVGVTPAIAEGLTSGEHFVTLKRQGYRKTVQPVTVSSKAQGTVEIKLERSGKFLLVEEALRAVEREIGHDVVESDIDNLKDVLFLDQAVFIRAVRASAGRVRVDAHLYDLRSHRRLATETHEVADQEVEKTIQQAATSLYMNVRYDAEIEAPKDEPVPVAQKKRGPIYKRWWFWTIIGVAVAGVGVTTGILVEKYRPQSCGDGNVCTGFSF